MSDPFLWLILTVIGVYKFIVFVAVVVQLLVQFDVINTSNRFVYLIYDFLRRATEPAFSKIRQYLPSLGGIDLSPLVLLIGLEFLGRLIDYYWPL
ncbi:MAG: YggT family protein [Alphaproteobacteria bacterium]|nr:YggT family protein [Alphaproteobacteria bacterium SS10]